MASFSAELTSSRRREGASVAGVAAASDASAHPLHSLWLLPSGPQRDAGGESHSLMDIYLLTSTMDQFIIGFPWESFFLSDDYHHLMVSQLFVRCRKQEENERFEEKKIYL